tara:strand:- start:2074 stop:2709 length:636 start_codon:yes stop_codon:yes gene_type:complete
LKNINNIFSAKTNLSPLLRFEKLELSNKRVDEMYSYSKINDFYKFLETSPHVNKLETKNYLKSLIKREKEGSHGGKSIYWSIIDQKTDIMIGTIGFVSISEKQQSSCTTMGISNKFRGSGRALEAMITLLEYGFTKMNFHRIWAITHHENKPVILSHKLFGFKEEGILRDYYYDGKNYINANLLACLDNDYTCVKAISTLALLRKINLDKC